MTGGLRRLDRLALTPEDRAAVLKRHFISREEAAARHGIPLETLSGYELLRELPDGTLCGVLRLLYHYSVHVGIDYAGYSRRWCFGDVIVEPALALLAYDGGDEMPGPWRKDVERGIYQDPETGARWHEGEPPPKGAKLQP
jgi:hypothetical protein